jgi:hypothetical protein
MDKYTKFVLTVIAVGIIGLNIHFFKNAIISPAEADSVGGRFGVLRLVDYNCYANGSDIVCAQSNLKF